MSANRVTPGRLVNISRRLTPTGLCWFAENRALPQDISLSGFLRMRSAEILECLGTSSEQVDPFIKRSPPVEDGQEVWAAGVTYLRSRQEREAESTVADVYAKVYDADRPELFFKSIGSRVVGPSDKIRIRRDSAWNVPEPELTLVINCRAEIVGYTAGNDVSSRSIEGENPLYLPQAKCYDGSCAVGPEIVLCDEAAMDSLPISCMVNDECVGTANTDQMRRSFSGLVKYLFREMSFPNGVFLMTGTGIVPSADFSLKSGDVVTVNVGELVLVNTVE